MPLYDVLGAKHRKPAGSRSCGAAQNLKRNTFVSGPGGRVPKPAERRVLGLYNMSRMLARSLFNWPFRKAKFCCPAARSQSPPIPRPVAALRSHFSPIPRPGLLACTVPSVFGIPPPTPARNGVGGAGRDRTLNARPSFPGLPLRRWTVQTAYGSWEYRVPKWHLLRSVSSCSRFWY